MIARRWLLALAVLAGILSAALYAAATQRIDIAVAARDMTEPRPIERDDLELRAVDPQLVPVEAILRIEDAIGLVPRVPLLRGQLLLRPHLGRDVAEFASGLTMPAGHRAVALPVNAVAAAGGTVVAGARVDVLAIPVAGRAPAGRGTELLAVGVLVLDVRGESGAVFVRRAEQPAMLASDRIASVVVAVPQSDLVRFADRIGTSTFVLALASAR